MYVCSLELPGASFITVKDLQEHIDAFIADYNENYAIRLD